MPHTWTRTRITNVIPSPEKDFPEAHVALFLAQRDDGVPFYVSMFFESFPTDEQVALKAANAKIRIDMMIDEDHPDLVRDFGEWFNSPLIMLNGAVVLSEN